MTNKEAIKILSNRDSFGIPKGYTSGYAEAIDMAIKALSKMDAKENYWAGCESCDRAMEDGECELWGDRMTEECGGWREKENEFYNRNA